MMSGIQFAWPALAWLALPGGLVVAVLLRRLGASATAVVMRAVGVVLLLLALAQPELVRGAAVNTLTVVDGGLAGAALGVVDPDGAAVAGGLGVLTTGDNFASLAGGLDAASRAVAAGGRVALVTDGSGIDEALLATARQARARGVAVDLVAVVPPQTPDAAVTALAAPPRWRSGSRLPIGVTVRASRPGALSVTLRRDGEVVATRPVTLTDGVGMTRFWSPAGNTGPVRWSAEVALDGDVTARNDTAFGLTWIAAPARVLVVGDGPGAVTLADHLRSGGLATAVLAPDRLPGRLSSLAAWDALALVDVPATALGVDQRAAVMAFAAKLGRGVLLTGGRQSFLPGGWAGTPLAEMAPVRLDTPPRDQRDAVALLLMIDQSASMGSTDGAGGVSKLALAREAAALAAESLHAGDQLGIVAYDDAARWLVPLGPTNAADRPADFGAALGELVSGGGTRILSALELGLPALASLDVPTRHAVLLTDGRDFSPDAVAYDTVVRAARDAGVTLSTIALGTDADQALLMRLAERGRGRFHLADDPGDLPRLTVQESETVRARAEQHGRFQARVAGPVIPPALTDVDVANLPPLTGYLAVTTREEADTLLEAPNGDPLLAAWQVGPGRVAAWLSDTGEDWASAWTGASASAFWTAVASYLAPLPGDDGLGVTVVPTGTVADVSLEALDRGGLPLDLASVSLQLTDTVAANGLGMPQVAPGRYAARVSLPEPGAYPAALRVTADGISRTMGVGLVTSPGAFPAADSERQLSALLQAGGGRRLQRVPVPQSPEQRRRPLGPLLVVLVALLWPLDVALQLGQRFSLRRRAALAPAPIASKGR